MQLCGCPCLCVPPPSLACLGLCSTHAPHKLAVTPLPLPSLPPRRYLAYNNLTGTIPSSWQQLASLETVQVQPGNPGLCTASLPTSAQFDLCATADVVCSADSLAPDGPQCASRSSSDGGGGSSFPAAAVAVPVALVGAAVLAGTAFLVVRRRRAAAVASAAGGSKAGGAGFATAQELQQVGAACCSGVTLHELHAVKQASELVWRCFGGRVPTLLFASSLPASCFLANDPYPCWPCLPPRQDLEQSAAFNGEALVKVRPSPASSAPRVFGSLPSSMGSKPDASGGSGGKLQQQTSGSGSSALLQAQSSLLDILSDWHIDPSGGWRTVVWNGPSLLLLLLRSLLLCCCCCGRCCSAAAVAAVTLQHTHMLASL